MVNSVSGVSVNPVTVVDLGSKLSNTDQKIAEVKAKIFELTVSIESLGATCDALRGKLAEVCSIPSRFGLRVSNEPGELGELETEMFALEKKQNHLSRVANNLKEQLATAEFDTKVENARADKEKLKDLDNQLADKITELERRLKAEGKKRPVIASKRMQFVVCNEKSPLSLLIRQNYSLQNEIRYKRDVIEALEKQLR
ncbi:MAG: hypothetical protein JSS09_07955 [Verrucomicrobia bacterium]|nr:hypothetical protein [Verrucomicrobiota bacterium]